MFRRAFALSTVMVFCLAAAAVADDVYYDLPISQLELTEQKPQGGEAERFGRSTAWRWRSVSVHERRYGELGAA